MTPPSAEKNFVGRGFSPLKPLAVAVLLLPLSAAILFAGPAPRHAASKGSSSSADSPFAPDKGKFRIFVNGHPAGEEQFEIASGGGSWIAHGTSEIQANGATTRVTGTLTLRPDGAPVRYEWSTVGAKKASAIVTFDGLAANVDLQLEGEKPYSQQFKFNSAPIVVLDNNLYHHYALLARLYDWSKKGAQTFSVLVPQSLAPGTVTVDSLGKQDVDGKDLDELRVKSEDLELDLYLDGPRLERVISPGANAQVIRE
jgi:hypothetical protein